jgi:hypothetical protein
VMLSALMRLSSGSPVVCLDGQCLISRLRKHFPGHAWNGASGVCLTNSVGGLRLPQEPGEREGAQFPPTVLPDVHLRHHEGIADVVTADNGVEANPVQHDCGRADEPHRRFERSPRACSESRRF